MSSAEHGPKVPDEGLSSEQRSSIAEPTTKTVTIRGRSVPLTDMTIYPTGPDNRSDDQKEADLAATLAELRALQPIKKAKGGGRRR